MKRVPTILIFTLCLFLSQSVFANPRSEHSHAQHHQKTKITAAISSEAGLNIPEWGLAIDAFYDPQLTDLIPDYHIINIVITNRRSSTILLDPKEDKWVIVDSAGKKHIAKNHVRMIDEKLWAQLPNALKNKLDYPHAIKPGNFTTVDVFIPKDVDMFNFRSVSWHSRYFNKEFSIFTNYEKSLSLGDVDKQQPIPQNTVGVDTPTQNLAPSQILTGTQTDSPLLLDETDQTAVQTTNATNPTKWERQRQEEEQAKDPNAGVNFDPSLDNTIIIR